MEGKATATGPRLRRIGYIHWRGLAALYAMELKRFLRLWQISVAGPAITAMLYLTVIGAAIGAARATAEGEFLVLYVGTGLMTFAVLERATGNLAFSFVIAKLERTIEEILMSPLGPVELIAGYVLAAATGAVLTGAVVAVPVIVLLDLAPAAPAAFLVFVPLTGLLGASVGLLIGLGADKFDHLTAWLTFVIIPAIFFSGVFVPPQRLPAGVDAVVAASPFHHALAGIRYAFFGADGAMDGATPSQPGVNALVLGLWIAACLTAGAVWLHRGYKLKA